MRELTDAERLRRFMQALGQEAEREARVYFTGGATAVLMGWRATTIDADITIVPESDRILRALPALKERLRMNVELAAPSHFIPPLPGWEERSPFIGRESKVSFHHYDLYSQALAKIERGHVQDRSDVREMLARRLVTPDRIRELFEKIAPELYRYPALDPSSFRRAVEETLSSP
jgi:Nucleotidyltransferase of unknown function (DUF6036)